MIRQWDKQGNVMWDIKSHIANGYTCTSYWCNGKLVSMSIQYGKT